MRIEVLKPFRYVGRPYDAGKRYSIDDPAGHFYIRTGCAKPMMQPTLADYTPERLEEGTPAGAGVVPTPSLPVGEGAGGPQMTPNRATPEAKPAPRTAYDRLVNLFGNDYVEIFGPAGSGKSRLLAHVALEAKRTGQSVHFLDCEHSLPRRIEEALGASYHRIGFMDLNKVIDAIAGIPRGTKLACYDSLGFPILIRAAQMSMRERGDAYFKSYLIRGWLKEHAERNSGLSLGANQPVSEIWEATRDEEEVGLVKGIRPPTGGKSIHVARATLRIQAVQRDERRSVFELRTYECQDMAFDKLLATFTISDQGERLEWKVQ